MKRHLALFTLSAALLAAIVTPSHAKLVTKTVEYQQGGTPLEGYLAYDDKFPGKRPGIIVAHQWLGLTDYEKMRARMLAQMGYVAFALDIYGKGVHPQNTKEAGALAGQYKSNVPLLRARARAAVLEIRKLPNVDVHKLAAIGYCFGGGTVLELARSGADLKGFVSFHGLLDTPNPDDAKNIKGKILVCHGASDPNVTRDSVLKFWDEMTNAHVNWYFIGYGGAVHAFTQPMAGNDPSKGVAYNADADRRSWQAMKDFFAEIFH